MELSRRLEAVADLVTKGMTVADIGTDHAYIPIFLVEQKRIPSAIAMDINEGPLKRAYANITEHGFQNKIRTRRSDGLRELGIKEVESMIAAGMGGALIIRILSDCPEVTESLKECILQPQSEIGKVRRFLIENGFFIEKENIVYEDGKFYPMMRVIPNKKETNPYEEEEYEYGKKLLENRNPILKQFLEREICLKNQILERLSREKEKPERMKNRIWEIQKEISLLDKALTVYKAE